MAYPIGTLTATGNDVPVEWKKTTMTDLLETPPDTDFAYSWLVQVFPQNDMGTAFTAGMYVFSTAMSLLGLFMLSYHVVMGIVGTAYSGKVLGERWHQIYAPIRLVFGFGSLIPMTAVGLNGANLLMYEGAKLGNNLARHIALVTVKQIVEKGTPITYREAGGRDLIWQIVQAETCRAMFDARAKQDQVPFGITEQYRQLPPPGGVLVGKQTGLAGQISSITWSQSSQLERYVWDYGPECGKVSITMPPAPKVKDKDGKEEEVKTASGKTFAQVRYEAIRDGITALRTPVNGQQSIAQKYAEFFGTGPGGYFTSTEANIVNAKIYMKKGLLADSIDPAVQKLGAEYDEKILRAAKEDSSAYNSAEYKKLVEFVEAKGWLALSMYWRSLAQVADRTSKLVGERADYLPPDTSTWGTHLGINMKSGLDMLVAQRQAERYDVELTASDLAKPGNNNAQNDNEKSRISKWINDFTAKLMQPATEAVLGWATNANNPQTDPVGGLISMGHTFLNVAWIGIIALGVGGMLAGNWGSEKLGLHIAALLVAPFLVMLIKTFLLAGIAFAYVMPMIPFVFMFMAAVSWIVYVISCTVASSVWAFLFIRMDGQELVDVAQRQGMLILFNMILRPALLVLGFSAGMMVHPFVLNTLNSLWAVAFVGSSGANGPGLFGFVAGLVMHLYITWQLTVKIFGLVTQIPDEVASLYGASPSRHDEAGSATAMTAGAVAMGSQVGNNALGLAGDRHSQKKIADLWKNRKKKPVG